MFDAIEKPLKYKPEYVGNWTIFYIPGMYDISRRQKYIYLFQHSGGFQHYQYLVQILPNHEYNPEEWYAYVQLTNAHILM